MAQYIGGFFIIVGIILNQVGAIPPSKIKLSIPVTDSFKEADLEIGFKGI